VICFYAELGFQQGVSMKLKALVLSLVSLIALGATASDKKPKSTGKVSRLVSSAKDAKAIAEQDTGGIAVSARRVPLNGASGGWEVEVHMPKDTRGWLCVIDNDTRMVHTKTHIPNPSLNAKRR
jgi:hypothetical protein